MKSEEKLFWLLMGVPCAILLWSAASLGLLGLLKIAGVIG